VFGSLAGLLNVVGALGIGSAIHQDGVLTIITTVEKILHQKELWAFTHLFDSVLTKFAYFRIVQN